MRARLEDELRRVCTGVFGGAAGEVSVRILEIPAGRFFTAGAPSCSSLIGAGVPAGTAPADRVRLMSEITATWCEVTGCTPRDVVVAATDA